MPRVLKALSLCRLGLLAMAIGAWFAVLLLACECECDEITAGKIAGKGTFKLCKER